MEGDILWTFLNVHHCFKTLVFHFQLRLSALSLLLLTCFSCVCLCAILWTVAHQAPLSMEFSRQEYWSGLPIPSPAPLSYLVLNLCCAYSLGLCILRNFRNYFLSHLFLLFWQVVTNALVQGTELCNFHPVASSKQVHKAWARVQLLQWAPSTSCSSSPKEASGF